jgi:hypothetical protein
MLFGAFGKGEATGCGPGVPRREFGLSLKKLSGMSFQLVMLFAAERGGAAGDAVPPRGGGGRGACCGGW